MSLQVPGCTKPNRTEPNRLLERWVFEPSWWREKIPTFQLAQIPLRPVAFWRRAAPASHIHTHPCLSALMMIQLLLWCELLCFGDEDLGLLQYNGTTVDVASHVAQNVSKMNIWKTQRQGVFSEIVTRFLKVNHRRYCERFSMWDLFSLYWAALTDGSN